MLVVDKLIVQVFLVLTDNQYSEMVCYLLTMLTITGTSFFKDIIPDVRTVSPTLNPDSIKTDFSVLVPVSTITSTAFPFELIKTFLPISTGMIDSVGIKMASFKFINGKSIFANEPGNKSPFELDAVAFN